MDVGIRELKAKLSSYLDQVAAGETIRVTEHGKPKAYIVPIEDDDPIERGIREGWLTVGPNFRRGANVFANIRTFSSRPGFSVAEFFDEERRE
jgi:prevent-host-death family protein